MRQYGQYVLEARLGRGGMGEVWRARHARLDRPAAVKLIRPEALGASRDTATLIKRFEREARSTSRLRSPNTVEIFDFGTAPDGTFWYAMELLEGVDLKTLITHFGPIAPARAVWVLRQACTSLAEAHEAGLLHRDIKPANVFLCRLGVQRDFVKLLDFGLVKPLQEDLSATDLTQSAVAPGSPAFMAPELINGDALDARADLYGLGCVGWWLLTGELVFQKQGTVQQLMAHLNTAPPDLNARSPRPVPEGLVAVIARCLAKDPADRFPDAMHLAEALDAIEGAPEWTDADACAWWAEHQPVEATRREEPAAELAVGSAELAPLRQKTTAHLESCFENSSLAVDEFERRYALAQRAQDEGALLAVLEGLPPLPIAADHPVPAVIAPAGPPATAAAPSQALVPAAQTGRARRWMVGVFGGAERTGDWQPARDNRGLALFGGLELDFTQVTLPPGETVMHAVALFGGVEIKVPKGLPVVVDGVGVFGAFSHKGDQPRPAPSPDEPSLRITGVALFGGVEVRVIDPDRPSFIDRILRHFD